ncbi:MAG: TonB-dependent receptor [Syntrophobacteraceae bacterium]
MKKGIVVAVIVIIFLSRVGWAQEIQSDDSQATKTFVFEEMIITTSPEMVQTEPISKKVLDWTRHINIGDVIDDTPGVSAVRRGANATEPVIRGLGWERVQTQIGPIPIYGGCPARMDPPITYLQPDQVQKVLVVKGVPSVTLGPGGTAGRIVVSTDYERSPDAPPEIHPWGSTKYDSARNGIWGGTGVYGGNKWLDFYLALDALNYGDYESANGTEVPADKEEAGGALSLGFRPLPNHRWYHGLNYIRDEGFDSPSLPMDSDKTDTWIYNTGYRIDLPGHVLEQLEVNGGFSMVDHLMSNRNRSDRRRLHAETPTDSDSYAVRFKQEWRLNPDMRLTTGVDYYDVARDAVRERFLVPQRRTFFDHVWPDVSQSDGGFFAELNADLAPKWHLRTGGRIDYAQSQADAADDITIGGIPIRQQFVNFNGPDAADVDRDDLLGSGNIVVEWETLPELLLHAGTGVVSRPANVTERFYAFSPAPGGFQIGNPTLDPEVKFEIDLGAEWRTSWGVFTMSGFHYWVSDFILPTLVARQDVDNNGTIDNVRGFRNVDARLYGGELSAVLKPVDHWSFPVSLSYVRGEDTSHDEDLPEIPPFEARVAVRADYGTAVPWWVEFGGRFVARQDAVSDSFPENETAGFAVFHIFAGVQPIKGLRILMGIENLFDKQYHEHLTREALFSTRTLAVGDEIPSPGIGFHAMARYDF